MGISQNRWFMILRGFLNAWFGGPPILGNPNIDYGTKNCVKGLCQSGVVFASFCSQCGCSSSKSPAWFRHCKIGIAIEVCFNQLVGHSWIWFKAPKLSSFRGMPVEDPSKSPCLIRHWHQLDIFWTLYANQDVKFVSQGTWPPVHTRIRGVAIPFIVIVIPGDIASI